MRFAYCLLLLIAMLGMPLGKLAAQFNSEWGKNRIQYEQFHWQYLSTPNLDIYYYQGGKKLAETAVQYAEAELNRISREAGFTPLNKIKLFVYTSESDLSQSNMGLKLDDQGLSTTTKFYKPIQEVAFTGQQADFRRAIAFGIAQTLITDMLFNGDLTDILQSSIKPELSDWFVQGAIRYLAEGWSQKMDDRMRDAFLSRKRGYGSLLNRQPGFAGQSLWNYIAIRFGEETIASILNLTRSKKNDEVAISYTLGIPFERLIRDWSNFHRSMYQMADEFNQMPKKAQSLRYNNRRGARYTDVAISPDGLKVAYATSHKGRYKVRIHNRQTGRTRNIRREGFRLLNQPVNNSIPQLSWVNEKEVAVISLKFGQLALRIFDQNGKSRKTRILRRIGQVNDFDVSDDGAFAVLSASKNGQSDIFILTLSTGHLRRLTHDFYDDRQPQFLYRSRQIVFASNRPDTLLQRQDTADLWDLSSQFDLFLYQPQEPNSLTRLTQTPWNETHPRPIDKKNIVYLSSKLGISNIQKYYLPTGEHRYLSAFRQDIRQFDVNLHLDHSGFAFTMIHNGAERLFFQKAFSPDNYQQGAITRRKAVQTGEQMQIPSRSAPPEEEKTPDTLSPHDPNVRIFGGRRYHLDSNDIDIRHYTFQNEKPQKPSQQEIAQRAKASSREQKQNQGQSPQKLDSLTKNPSEDNPVLFSGPFDYKNRLSYDQVTTDFFTIHPLMGWGMHFNTRMHDLFEHHRFKANALAILDFRSSILKGEYEYLRHRVDFRASYTKKAIFIDENILRQRLRLDHFEVGAAYPFNVTTRLEINPFFSSNEFDDLRLDPQLAESGDGHRRNFWGFRASFIHDNTRVEGLNIRKGRRMRIDYASYHNPSEPARNFANLEVDLRNYLPLWREMVLATRAFYGAWMGNSPKQYLLGGMDNWANATTQETENLEDPLNLRSGGVGKTDWLFMKYAMPMRGFNYNQAFGQNVLLGNAELRMPLFKMFSQGAIHSAFFRNFQLVGFADVGASWTGTTPFEEGSNEKRRVATAPQSPFRIEVIDYQNPFLQGYGAGLRTTILKTFVKFDLAWGRRNYEWLDPQLYVTFGKDF